MRAPARPLDPPCAWNESSSPHLIPCDVHDFSYAVRLPDETTRVFLGPLREVPFGPLAEAGCLLIDEGVDASHGRALEDLVARVGRRPALRVVVAGGQS